ncbi:methyltransferase, CheR-like [Candidatus Protochlamydia naegleriophila]|uniref:Methyltransferase, CheR-like n=2 Tax=Candidatus Protochlamydia naegleriophila TaxID=389348 RepID=A0A0U5JDG2_9BACT|nr:methyltransferase, CheR-like [Candidatus Protochlamydia naegleriophila]
MGNPNFFHCIIRYIENKMGLKPNRITDSVWEWVIKERMNLCNLGTHKEYYERLVSSSGECQELVELVVVPETWFFRDKGSLDFLVRAVRQNSHPLIKILSLPCSTGEEPYSIVMALFDDGVIPFRFVIDAADVSQKSLLTAQKGVYGKKSFRGRELGYRDFYFKKNGDGYAIDSIIKEQVHFYYHNVMDEKADSFGFGSYHFIFCRNLLIYLSEKGQARAFRLIRSLLAPDGILIVGPAETQLAQNGGFVPIHYPKAYAFAQETAVLAPSIEQFTSQLLLDQTFSEMDKLTNSKEDPFLPIQNLAQSLTASLTVPEKSTLLEKAKKLADSGDFDEAVTCCLNYIYKHGANETVYYLLGLIQHAMGDEAKAEEFFRKVVYLEPSHYEALIYLTLLSEKKGDFNQAELFRRRAQRAFKI